MSHYSTLSGVDCSPVNLKEQELVYEALSYIAALGRTLARQKTSAAVKQQVCAAKCRDPGPQPAASSVNITPHRGTKRSAKDSEEAALGDENNGRSQKRSKLNTIKPPHHGTDSGRRTGTLSEADLEAMRGRFPSTRSRTQASRPSVPRPQISRRKKEAVPSPPPPSTVPRATAASIATASASTNENNDDSDRLSQIANGTILPRNEQEALGAQAVRYRDMLAKHTMRAVHQSRPKPHGKGYIPTKSTPELLPEFWSRRNFIGLEAFDGPVRCICGATTDDDAEDWIACDDPDAKCGGSWQHVGCVGGAVDRQKWEQEGYEYLCQMCDPWRHRAALRRLRRGEAI